MIDTGLFFRHHKRVLMAVGISGGVLVVVAAIVIVCCVRRRKRLAKQAKRAKFGKRSLFDACGYRNTLPACNVDHFSGIS